ncbi:MAG: sensor domain-containing diguanylate cyclase [Caldilineaceae bacterium]|nr:sensor domain-containing diguanylate cyclase [Caldilineaceae bacterium]
MDMNSFNDFETAGSAVLKFLHRRLGFDLWMVTRTEGDDWIVLQTEDHGYGVEAGTVFKWADSFCSEMVKGNGPRIASNSEQVPAYAAAPIGRQVQINAYVGCPLVGEDGEFFGTLCAIHPSSQPESITGEQELVDMLGALLSSILQIELKMTDEIRRAERIQMEAAMDVLTQVYNRRGWDRLLAAEEERCRRYGHPAAVLVIDLDEMKQVNDTLGHAAGDALLKKTGELLRQAARQKDVVARLGGDEFGILAIECDWEGGETLLERVRAVLAEESIAASIGLGQYQPGSGLKGAWERADQRMYIDKRER